jgi:hypothetical protein
VLISSLLVVGILYCCIQVAACDLPGQGLSRKKVNPGVLNGVVFGFGVFAVIVALNFYCWK